jgi:hypothetical protein
MAAPAAAAAEEGLVSSEVAGPALVLEPLDPELDFPCTAALEAAVRAAQEAEADLQVQFQYLKAFAVAIQLRADVVGNTVMRRRAAQLGQCASPWLVWTIQAHTTDAPVVRLCTLLLHCILWGSGNDHLSVGDTVRAVTLALEAHPGVQDIVRAGLVCLATMSANPANAVCAAAIVCTPRTPACCCEMSKP